MIQEVRKRFDEMVALYPERDLFIIPKRDGTYEFPDKPNDFAGLFIEIHGNVYHYIARERGIECMHDSTEDLDELMFWIYRDYTRWLASRYELYHRIESEDSRRQWMAIHVQLLRRASESWASRVKRYYEGCAPFSDGRGPHVIEEDKYQIRANQTVEPTRETRVAHG